MVVTHTINELQFLNDKLIINIDGSDYTFELDMISLKLKEASEVQRSLYFISPSGYGIHWPLLDEDLSVSALLKMKI
jgi:hypothetical protein